MVETIKTLILNPLVERCSRHITSLTAPHLDQEPPAQYWKYLEPAIAQKRSVLDRLPESSPAELQLMSGEVISRDEIEQHIMAYAAAELPLNRVAARLNVELILQAINRPDEDITEFAPKLATSLTAELGSVASLHTVGEILNRLVGINMTVYPDYLAESPVAAASAKLTQQFHLNALAQNLQSLEPHTRTLLDAEADNQPRFYLNALLTMFHMSSESRLALENKLFEASVEP